MNHKNGDVRQRETLRVLTSFLKGNPSLKPDKYLDLGCGDGSFTLKVARLINAREVYGVDIVGEMLAEAGRKGIKTYVADLNTDRLPFADGEFDVVSAFEVIEHLWNTDNMISEAYRVLKTTGLFILTTPNLASWVNRLLLLFGYLPVHYGCSLKVDLEKRPLESASGTCEHMRLYTFKTLRKHLETYGFKVIYSTSYPMGYVSSHFVVKMLNRFFSIRKTLGAGMFFIAVKE
jgi:ubiquinone/menaquinone biosynthesis C-methylase UbiE